MGKKTYIKWKGIKIAIASKRQKCVKRERGGKLDWQYYWATYTELCPLSV